ncbi:MAG: sterol desaturase family protein [Pseudomonadota bacterium]
MLRSIVRFGFVPFMLIGLNGLGIFAVLAGWSYLWLGLILLVAIGTAFVAERISPWHAEWNQSHDDETTTIFHAVVYEISNINAILLIPVVTFLLPSIGIWPTSWPVLAQLLLAIVLADFALTYLHYLSHKWSFLWRLHAVHHGVGRLYGFNGLVRHPLHQTIDLALGTSPLVIAGMPTEVAILLGLAISIQLIIQHANVSYVLGPFRNWLSIGELHHHHHVNWGTEGDCNFGLFFTVWDRMLGTFQPEPPRPITSNDMGIDEVPNFPKTYWQQLLFPFYYKPGAGEQEVFSDARRETRADAAE